MLKITRSWWVMGLVLHARDKNSVIPALLWAVVSLRTATLLLPLRRLTKPLRKAWVSVSGALVSRVGERLRFWVGTVAAFLVMAGITYATPETRDNTYVDRTIGALGFGIAVLLLWGTSRHRRQVNWRTVNVGILLQFLLGVLVMRSKFGVSDAQLVEEPRLCVDAQSIGTSAMCSNSLPRWPTLSLDSPSLASSLFSPDPTTLSTPLSGSS